MELDQDT